jgi:hypothetical protein
MEALMDTVLKHLYAYDWQSPITFIFIALGILALLGRWGIVLTIVLTLIAGSFAHNLIILNQVTSEALIAVPVVIYWVGGILVGLSLLVQIIRNMLL